MINYLVVQEENFIDFQKTVQRYLDKGYKPQGGVFVRDIGMGAYYLQALIKEYK